MSAHGNAFLNPGVEDVVFCFLRFPSGKIAHLHLSWLDPAKMRKLTVVGRDKMAVFDDMELERKVTIYEKWPEQPAQTFGEWQTRTGDILSPKIASDEPLRLELSALLPPRPARRHRGRGPRWARRRPRARTAPELARAGALSGRDPRDRDRLPGDAARRGRPRARRRRRGKATDALTALDREARAAATDRGR